MNVHPVVDRLLKKVANEAVGERKPEVYLLRHVEDFVEPRTKTEERCVLARRGWAGGMSIFFSSLRGKA